MRDLRRIGALILALPVWLALPALASGQVLSADVNGDGVRDRIEAGPAPAELIVQLSTLEPAQHLKASGAILAVAVADIDRDGRSDLIATTAGRRHIRLVVWMNAGSGRFVARAPRDALQSRRLGHRRVATPDVLSAEDDLWGDATRLFVLASAVPQARPVAADPLAVDDGVATALDSHDQCSPRGPPALRLIS
jgi:hypothetical protein